MRSDFYRAFEEKFRGPRERIKSRLQAYIPFVLPLRDCWSPAPAIDLGCGRGEWLELLSEWGFQPLGIDEDAGMLEACHELGLEVEQGDVIAYLHSLRAESQVLVSAFHVVEHLPFNALRTLVSESMRVLKPGGLLIMETPNPENLVVATCNFYLDPTHQRPIPAQLLAFVAEHTGFARVKTLRLQESNELAENDEITLADVFRGASPDYAVIAQKHGPEAMLALFNEAFAREYGLSQDQLLGRWDAANKHFHHLIQQAEARAEQAEARAEQALTQLRAVYASASWRITAPLRRVGGKTFRLSSRSDLKQRVIRLLQHPAHYANHHPRLRNAVLAVLNRFPSLKHRLAAILVHMPAPAAIRQDNRPELAEFTPRARQIHADLKSALARRQQENG